MTSEFLNLFFDSVKHFFVNIEINKRNLFLGFAEESLFLNFLIIFVKKYIYKCKLEGNLPKPAELRNRLKYFYSLELYTARKHNNVSALEKFWAPIKVIYPEW